MVIEKTWIENLRNEIHILKNKYGCSGFKMSTEDSGHSLESIDFMNNRILYGILPLNMKIGGPDARTDILNGLKIGVSGFIGPMIESSFGVKKFSVAVQKYVDDETKKKLQLSINLESYQAYLNIDEILETPEIEYLDQIVVGSSDLANSVSKRNSNDELISMVREIAVKAKAKRFKVRIGGIMELCVEHPNKLNQLLKETNVDRINTSNTCFNVKEIPDIRKAYVKALIFEQMLNGYWYYSKKAQLDVLENKYMASKKKVENPKFIQL